MVDTGAQSTIISRSLLHAIGRRAKSEGHPLPVLEQTSVRLYGKDGKGGGWELTITAELQVTLEGDCKSICVFVQPNSEQKCLLGMNAIPSLGISVLRANGEPLIPASEPTSPKVANVCLVRSTTIPSQKGRSVKAHIDCDFSQGDHFPFWAETWYPWGVWGWIHRILSLLFTLMVWFWFPLKISKAYL